ncbi:DUF2157 domain-containing protein [Janthinobacterium sp. SUN176]|uniref:DUF2157 domain-containing protein n=1 Tax=unclassified Janthinobacterium TaxID=2610881 RepID=UPI0025B48E4F|nr:MULTISPECIES: DUF2157 domain-containing protein [unclassified Janthinobacterium]MDN2702724.1 DUF2157 domain-containing protein [Janthinobacterium sp. SUN100]MDN2716211.1 DUF2157 domain-containing protein [Janthinobacterium sp. SUN120]MDO8048008.1 DUF2157 domain-containing protein [Janthinobacterium sp. SUN211]MDO8073094.1 DUF2157 domain-containing protein [Janthinobacterium sp. SUN176]
MDLRLAVYQLASDYALDAQQTRQLQEVAGFQREPARLAYWLPRGVAVLGAVLLGMGLICWVAANWEDLGRMGRFALLQGVLAAACVGAFAVPKARVPLLLLALLAIGGLFAYFGQTYQTGADPWQLFALWAALALPLCLVARSDVLWTPWMLILSTAATLWMQAHAHNSWRVDSADLPIFIGGWLAVLAGCAFVSPLLARWTGAGSWALRLGLVLATFLITGTAVSALFGSEIESPYWAGLGLLAVAGVLLATRQFFDVFGLSAVALGLNTLLVWGLGHVLFHGGGNGDGIGRLVMLGLFAAVLLALTVQGILWRTRREAA